MKKLRERIIRPFTIFKEDIIRSKDEYFQKAKGAYNSDDAKKVRLLSKELFFKPAVFGSIVFCIHLIIKWLGWSWHSTNEIAAALFVFSPTFMITFIWRQFVRIAEAIEMYNYAEQNKKENVKEEATVVFVANINMRIPAPIHFAMFGLAVYSIIHYMMNSYGSLTEEFFFVAGLPTLWYLLLKVALEIDDPIDGCYHLKIPEKLRKYIKKEEGIRAKIKTWI